MKINLFALQGLLAVCLITGCATSGPEAYVPLNTNVNGVENHDLTVLLDSRIQYSVSCPAVEKRAMAEGGLEITAHLRNRENRPMVVQVGCVFKDARGRAIKGEGVLWQNLTLGDSTPQPVRFVSHNPEVSRYTVCIRQPQ